jgi:hypothetical protein
MKRIITGIALSSIFFISAQQNPQQMPQQLVQYPWPPLYPQYLPQLQYPYYVPPMMQQSTATPLPMPMININAHSSAGADVKPTTTLTPTHTQLAPTHTQIQTQPIAQPVVPQPTLQERLQPFYASLVAFMRNHWIGCSCIAVGALYSGLVTYILYMRHRIQHTHLWSSWQRHQTMEQLMLQPHETLKAALVKDIAVQYINPDNPTDQVWPLTEFISACKREEKELRRYLTIAGLLKKTGLYKILPSLADEYAQQALTKLLFVSHLFASWSADITLQQLYKKGMSI